MLIAADPLVSLRLSDKRTVSNQVFVDDEPGLLSAQELKLLRLAIAQATPTIDPGYVDTFGRTSAQATACRDRVLSRLEAYLAAYGFVNDESRFEVARECQYMATRGAIPHADSYNSEWYYSLFWVLVVDSKEADLVFANLGLKVTMKPGQLIVFDPGQPHGVHLQGSSVFRKSDFPAHRRQAYLAGHMTMDEEFWSDYDVQLNVLHRPGQWVDVAQRGVHTRTGKVLVA